MELTVAVPPAGGVLSAQLTICSRSGSLQPGNVRGFEPESSRKVAVASGSLVAPPMLFRAGVRAQGLQQREEQ